MITMQTMPRLWFSLKTAKLNTMDAVYKPFTKDKVRTNFHLMKMVETSPKG